MTLEAISAGTAVPGRFNLAGQVPGERSDELLDTRVRRGADIASDHHLVQTCIRLKLTRITKPTSSRISYDVNKLRHESVRKEFTLELHNRFAVLEAIEDDDHNINSKWTQFSKAYNNTAENVLGRKKEK